MIDLWREMASDEGLPGLFLVGIVKNSEEGRRIKALGFDACTISRTSGRMKQLPPLQTGLVKVLGEKKAVSFYQKVFKKPFYVYDSKDLLAFIDIERDLDLEFFPCVMPNWDNTPRSGSNGQVFMHSDPVLFGSHLRQAIQRVEPYPDGHKIIIIKSWNEWAEGNHLEPDQRFGKGFLEAIRNVLEK